MSEQKKDKPRSKRRGVILWGGLLFIGILLNLAARLFPDFAEWYAVHVYPLAVGTMGRFLSLFQFSVVEMLIYLAALSILVGAAVLTRRKLVLGLQLPWQQLGHLLGKVLTVLLLLFTLNCGINYQRMPFSQRAGFVLQESTEEELIALCEWLVEELNREAEQIALDGEGHVRLTGDVQEEARKAMQAVAGEYPELGGYYPKAKPVLSTWSMSCQLIQGQYSPFTVEANYNRGMPDQDKPSTICHELSHLKGFMREDEANFIAYLACRASDAPEFRYSGSILAYIYSGNALHQQDREAFLRVREKLSDQVIRDLQDHNAYWDAYRGTAAELSNKVNDAYLKVNAQADGTKSYGRMVDLLLARSREQGNI